MNKFVNEIQDIASLSTSVKQTNETTTLSVTSNEHIQSEDSDDEILTTNY